MSGVLFELLQNQCLDDFRWKVSTGDIDAECFFAKMTFHKLGDAVWFEFGNL